MDWNFGDMLDAVGAALGPDDLALAHGERRIYWPGFTARTNRLARALLAHGIARGDKAGFYMRNQPEYMEAMAACFKASLSPVNVNYRYLDDELVYIIDNSDSTVVFFDSSSSPKSSACARACPASQHGSRSAARRLLPLPFATRPWPQQETRHR